MHCAAPAGTALCWRLEEQYLEQTHAAPRLPFCVQTQGKTTVPDKLHRHNFGQHSERKTFAPSVSTIIAPALSGTVPEIRQHRARNDKRQLTRRRTDMCAHTAPMLRHWFGGESVQRSPPQARPSTCHPHVRTCAQSWDEQRHCTGPTDPSQRGGSQPSLPCVSTHNTNRALGCF